MKFTAEMFSRAELQRVFGDKAAWFYKRIAQIAEDEHASKCRDVLRAANETLRTVNEGLRTANEGLRAELTKRDAEIERLERGG